jgi:hypothetical protein
MGQQGESITVSLDLILDLRLGLIIVCTRCLAHVVQLAIVDIMSHITKIAAVETTTAIWEYDPDLPNNRVLKGSLDVIAAIRTVAIKVSFD